MLPRQLGRLSRRCMKTCYCSTSHTTFFKEFGSVGVDASLVECEREVLNHPVLLIQSAIDRGKMMRQTNYSLAPIG